MKLEWSKLLCGLILIQVSTTISSQGGLAAYTDYLRRFYIFDHGSKKLIEGQQVKSFKVGGNCIAYVDYANNFKVYQNGKVRKLELSPVQDYIMTNNLMAYRVVDIWKVYDNGKVTMLSSSCRDVSVSDSLIVFFDNYYNSINGYYNGKVFSRRLRWVGATILKQDVGANIAGIITAEDRNFWVFYRGDVQIINQQTDNINFEAGKDILAYMDQPTRTFKTFYKGSVYDLESFVPKSFKVGDGRVVYVDANGNFKTFFDGRISTISTYEPNNYDIRDSLVVYSELGRLKCFYQDRYYEVAPYVPEDYKYERNLVVYIDRNRNLQIFSNGESKSLNDLGSQTMINSFELIRDVVVLNVDVNKTLIYYKGKIYY